MVLETDKPLEQKIESQHTILQVAEHVLGVGLGAVGGMAVGAVLGAVGGGRPEWLSGLLRAQWPEGLAAKRLRN